MSDVGRTYTTRDVERQMLVTEDLMTAASLWGPRVTKWHQEEDERDRVIEERLRIFLGCP